MKKRVKRVWGLVSSSAASFASSVVNSLNNNKTAALWHGDESIAPSLIYRNSEEIVCDSGQVHAKLDFRGPHN